MRKFPIAVVALALLSSGCTTATYSRRESNGENVTFKITSFATKKSFGDLSLIVSTNQTRTMNLKGYNNDQVQAIGIAVDAAVKAAVSSVKP